MEARLPNRIGKQTLVVDVDSQERALSVRARIGDNNRKRLIPLIERIIADFETEDRVIKIGRLNLDLGNLDIDQLETQAESRLEVALREALERSIQEATTRSTGQHRILSVAQSQIALLEHYLLYGTLPHAAGQGAGFSFADLFRWCAEEAPHLLASLIVSHGHKQYFLKRLAFQLSDSQFQELIHLLEPEHAVLILTYLVDLRSIHRVEPLLKMSDDRYAKELRIIVLTYLACERGSQFNRQSFLNSMLEAMAQRVGVDYRRLLHLFHAALIQSEKRLSLKSSLPAAIRELAAAADREDPVDRFDPTEKSLATKFQAVDAPHQDGPFAKLSSFLKSGTPTATAAANQSHQKELAELFRSLRQQNETRLRNFLRAEFLRAANRNTFIARLSVFSPSDLIDVLVPNQKEPIYQLLAAVSGASPLPGDTTGSSSIRDVVIKRLLESKTNSRTLHELIADTFAGVPSTKYIPAVERTIAQLRNNPSNDGKRLIEELTAFQKLARDGTEDERKSRGSPEHDRLASNPPRSTRFNASAEGITQPAPSFRRYDQADWACFLVQHGFLPWQALLENPKLTSRGMMVQLLRMPPAWIHSIFARKRENEEWPGLIPVLKLLKGQEQFKLLSILVPALSSDGPFRSAFESHRDAVEDKSNFYVRMIFAVVHQLPIDFESVTGGDVASPQKVDAVGSQGTSVRSRGSELVGQILLTLQQRGNETHSTLPNLSTMMDRLLRSDAQEARRFLQALSSRATLRNDLLGRLSPTQIERVLEICRPSDVSFLSSLATELSEFLISFRPGNQATAFRKIADMVLGHSINKPLCGDLFVDIVFDLFGKPCPERVVERLIRSIEKWKKLGAFSGSQWSAVQSAMRTIQTKQNSTSLPGSVETPNPSSQQDTDEVASKSAEAQFVLEAVVQHLADAAELPESRQQLQRVLENSTPELQLAIEPLFQDKRIREKWVDRFPEPILARLAAARAPEKFRKLIDTAELLMSTFWDTAPGSVRASLTRKRFWSFMLEFLSHRESSYRSPEMLTEAYFRFLNNELPMRELSDTGDSFVDRLAIRAREVGNASLVATLHRDRDHLLSHWNRDARQMKSDPAERDAEPKQDSATPDSRSLRPAKRNPQPARKKKPSAGPATPPSSVDSETAFQLEEGRDFAESGEPIYIGNAGLVLLGPFLPHLFKSLELLHAHDDGSQSLGGMEQASRAVHLLQFIVDNRTDASEPELALNKLLCGIPLGTPVEKEIDLTDREIEFCQTLHRSMISNWTIIKNTSVAGLQETFLQREGRLRKSPDRWDLVVQRKTLDVLVDQIPWSISVILHRWMTHPIHVSW